MIDSHMLPGMALPGLVRCAPAARRAPAAVGFTVAPPARCGVADGRAVPFLTIRLDLHRGSAPSGGRRRPGIGAAVRTGLAGSRP